MIHGLARAKAYKLCPMRIRSWRRLWWPHNVGGGRFGHKCVGISFLAFGIGRLPYAIVTLRIFAFVRSAVPIVRAAKKISANAHILRKYIGLCASARPFLLG